MTPVIAKARTRKSPTKAVASRVSAGKSPRATAKVSTRKLPDIPASKTTRSRPNVGRATRKLAEVSSVTVASQLARAGAIDNAAAKRKFEQGILARGEAVRAGKPLPPRATHEIVEETPDGSLVLKRKRFSMT
jgi:hypothetical protein